MTFAESTWLILLIFLPMAAGAAYFVWIRRGKQWHRLIAPRLRKRLSRTRAGTWHFISLGFALLGLGALIAALAQPEGGEEYMEHKSEGRNILFCLDISYSMLAQDVSPNRLTAAKAAAQEVMDAFPNDRAGLMVFSGESDVQVPLTIDRSYVRRAIQEVYPTDITTGGSDLARAIRDGTEILVKTGQKSNVMILLSDGEEHTAGLDNAARAARKEGIFVYVLGFGTQEGGKIPSRQFRDGFFRDKNRQVVHTTLNDTSLRLIAQETDGVYSHGVGPAFLKKLQSTIDEMEAFESEGKHLSVAKPLFQWFLLPGIILIMISVALRIVPTLRSGAAAALLLIAMISSARGDEIADGRKALEEKDFTEASRHFSAAARKSSGDQSARLHLAAGSAAYQAKNWAGASSSFAEALLSNDPKIQEQAHFALSNSLYYQGGAEEDIKKRRSLWQNAVEHLEEAATLNPDSTQAQENLNAVKKQIQNLKDPEQQEKEEEKKEEEKQENEDEQEKKDEQQQNKEDQQKEDQQKDGQDKQEGENQDKSEGEDKKSEDQEGKEGEQKKDEKEKEGDGEQKKDGNEKEGEGEENSDQKKPGEQNKDQSDQKGQGEEQKDDSQNPGEQSQDNQQQQGKGEQGKEAQQNQKNQKGAANQFQPGEESPKEWARRRLREFSDMGRRPPKKSDRYRSPRSAKDW